MDFGGKKGVGGGAGTLVAKSKSAESSRRSIYSIAIVHRPYGVKVVRVGRKGERLHLSHNHLESNPPRPPTPSPILPGKIAYLCGTAFASKSLGGDVNNDRATCTYGFSSSHFVSSPLPLLPPSPPSLSHSHSLFILSFSLPSHTFSPRPSSRRVSERERATAT